jgi:integrase
VKKEEFENDKATQEWLNSQKKSTSYTYKWAWNFFLEYAGMTGDQILADRKNDKAFKWEKRTLDFKRWMIEQNQQGENAAKTAATAVRGFFGFYRTPLVFRKTEKAKLREAKRKQEDYRFTKEDLRKMAEVGDLNEKYILTAGKSFGLRAGDFLALRRGDLEPYIDRPVPISIGEYDTQKENVKAYPFIDTDAQPIIKLMLEQMNREGLKEPDRRMLKYADSIQLSRVLQRLADKAGIQYGNKNVRFHCLRKFLIDHLSSHMSTEKWKQIVGKKITEGAYVSPDSLREDYERAMSETTFTRTVGESEIELRAAQRMLEMTLSISPNIPESVKETLRKKIRAVKKMKDLKPIENELTEQVKNAQQPKTETNGGCRDGEHCQRIVSEAELGGLLANGWRVAAVLPSGKIVISNE